MGSHTTTQHISDKMDPVRWSALSSPPQKNPSAFTTETNDDLDYCDFSLLGINFAQRALASLRGRRSKHMNRRYMLVLVSLIGLPLGLRLNEQEEKTW
jgi:hypothetical protein